MPFRFDRFGTLYLARPFRKVWPDNAHSIPILMYHSITNGEDTSVHPYYQTTTSPARFRDHMRQLHDSGFKTLGMADAVESLRNGKAAEGKVVITFDDGYSDFYQHAFPELNRYGFTATVFLPTGFIGNTSLQFKGRRCLTWTEVKELRSHGISFGSHTVTHPQLLSLDARTVKDELANSKQAIEDKIGEEVNSFAYPFAFPETRKLFVGTLRYSFGVCTCIGRARPQEDQYFLRRLPMNSHDDSSLFNAKLQGGYDWLHKVQYASKRLRGHS